LMIPSLGAKLRVRDRRWVVYNSTKGVHLCKNATLADTFRLRATGLLFRRDWSDLDGLLLVPCGSIHTFGMRMALDVCFLDRQLKIVAVRHDLKPWRLAAAGTRVWSTLELPSGLLEKTGTEAGDQLVLREQAEAGPGGSMASS
jgi:uncharacterized membrane protein (UPF0127 family)